MTKIRSSDSSMIDDRRGSGGGGGFSFPGMGGGGGGMGFPMKAGGGILGILIVLAATFLPRLLNSGSSTSQLGGSSGETPAEVADGTCSSELEQIVCGAEVDVQDYWATALPQFFGMQYTPARMQLVSSGMQFDTGCGAASSEVGPFYCPADQKVYIDLVFMQQLEAKLVGKTNDLAEQYIIAHEYGHHVQNLLGTNAAVQQASQNDPSNANAYSVALELQADCYAGAWVNSVNARGLLDSTDETTEALDAAAGVGDDRIQQQSGGRIDKDSWTHGSAEQRQTWFNRGFETGDPTQCTTVDEVL
jgi:uncharacterized protein